MVVAAVRPTRVQEKPLVKIVVVNRVTDGWDW